MDIHKRLELEAAAREEGSDIFYEAADEIARLRDELEAARLDADMQAREAGNMEYNSRVLMTERDEALGLAKRHMDEKHRTQQQAAEDWDVLQQRIKTAEAERDRLIAERAEFVRRETADMERDLRNANDERDRLREALRDLADIDGSPANVANAEVLASRVRNRARAALKEDRA